MHVCMYVQMLLCCRAENNFGWLVLSLHYVGLRDWTLVDRFSSKCFYLLCYLGFFCCSKALWPKAAWGGKDLFILHVPIIVYYWGRSGQEVKVGNEAKPWKDAAYWLSPSDLLSLLSYTPSCPGMALPTVTTTSQTHHQSRKCLTGQSNGGISQLSFPLDMM